ncbi:MAG: aminotransferase class III-fold pyridoxal phosphate-dependent enzyme, partial [Crocinitomicaceae bacterium]|nr:aminotransferase class III-fold pyridoxal phosphate-dependent enzyme [Crocinitomicaceae bacterium]
VSFYTLYGHLSRSCFENLKLNQHIKQGDKIAEVGNSSVNGNWTPHLHFQILLDLLGNKTNYPGTCIWKDKEVWSSICPDPNSIFKNEILNKAAETNSIALTEYRKEHLGKSLSLSYETPLYIVRGEGAYLIDTTGRKYLDTVNNVAHVGHEHPRVVKAGQQQMGLLNTNTRYLNENINAFAEALLSTFPDELSVVHFVNSGSEANELALRMAKANTGEKDMIAIEVGYHGNANACIDISSYKFDGKGGKGKPDFTQIVPLPDSFRGIYQGEGTGEKYASHVKEAIEEIQSKGRNVAAFIAESIISCGGQIELPEGYLKTAYESVRSAGGICISDEVQVGFGRVGKTFWGFELHEVVPDIVTVGKPIGNGHPMAAVVCTKAVAERFTNGMEYFNTFGGNPVSSAIGAEVLGVIKDEKLQEKALEIGNYLKLQLTELSLQFPVIGDVRGEGFFLGIELVDQDKTPLADHAYYLANRMKNMGILMSVDGPQHNVLKIKPPMVFSRENAEELISRMTLVFGEDFMHC